MYKKIWIIVFACLIASACGSDNEKNGFIDQSLQVMDGITGLARGGEQVVLGFVSDQGSEYSTTHRTDSDGKIYFKGSSEGQYRTSFSYFRGSGYDNFMEFRLSESDEGGTVVMTVEPPEEKRFASPVVITGIMSDPAGWDQGKTGANVTWGDGVTVYQHDGSYEYIQFLALEDIDFGTTPYSVICARNDQSSPVNPDGWAQGGDVTYKFELTEGYAAKGTFFYVGGNAMRISGFNKSCSYFSTRIDHANWIRVKNYPTEAGDGGIGNMTGNNDLLHDPNVPSVGKNVADGVAIFAGLAVDRNTIPADAVFYGSVLDKYAYDADTGSGYQVPDNEIYSRVHPETGTPQPYFGQGTNTFMFDDVAYDYDASEFLMLGGVFDTGKVYAARGATYKRIPTCPGDADVSDIETGEGVSYILSSGL